MFPVTPFPLTVRFVCAFVGWLIAFFLTARLMHAAGRMDGQTFGRVERTYLGLLNPVLEMSPAAATTWAAVAAALAVQTVVLEVLFRRWATYRPVGGIPPLSAARA